MSDRLEKMPFESIVSQKLHFQSNFHCKLKLGLVQASMFNRTRATRKFMKRHNETDFFSFHDPAVANYCYCYKFITTAARNAPRTGCSLL